MEIYGYSFTFVRHYLTEELLQKYLHAMSKEDLQEYIKQIGKHAFEFHVQDRYSQWWVMKTHKDIEKLASLKNTFIQLKNSTKKLQIEDFDNNGLQIVISGVHQNQSLPDNISKFFEIHNANIEKITSFTMQKKTRGLTCLKKCQNWCFGAEWTLKRIKITREGILEMADDGSVTDFLKFDQYFSVSSGMAATMHEFGIALLSAQRKIVLKARNASQFLFFLFYTIKTSQAIKQRLNFLGSCPKHPNNNIDFYIDAAEYFENVAKGIESAERDIMICGWWISPELYLIRPLNDEKYHGQQDYWRLDKLLQRRARAGVKIYIVVFFAPSIIPNNSDYTKKALTSLHPNIMVQRHPHEILPKLWSHHEKVVIIDQKVAFMGGLDLCFGRYDTKEHPIGQNDKVMYPGIDYNNVRIKDFVDVDKYDQELQDRSLPRLPWHDVAFRVIGGIVADVANHFVEYWNFTVLEKKIAPLATRDKDQADAATERENLSTKKDNQSTKNMKTEGEGQDLMGAILGLAMNSKDKQTIEYYMETKTKRQKISKFLRAQWLKNKKIQLYNGPGDNCLLLSVQSLGLLKMDKATRMNEQSSLQDELQLLRSASEWSIGLEEGVTERSIQNAYLTLIKNSKRFIYIENQFFISATGEKDSFVQNQIANTIYERIKKAIEKKEKFRVVVFMPLLPGMEGELTEKCPVSLKLTMYWQYNTISQNPQGLLPRVAKLTPHPEDYIQFYSLRAHGVLGKQPVTELIYIHTKLMIVDDHIVICGSANINDRSQAGNRDSELAVIFTKGKPKSDAPMNKQKFEVNEKAHDLRIKLYMEHFGMSRHQAEDPLSDETITLMRQIARDNTKAYDDIFGCCPHDDVATLATVKEHEKVMTEERKELYNMRAKGNQEGNFRGHAVQFPTQFLSKEKLYRLDLSKIQDIFT